jgi:glycosyltransferase domain-containing protein
MLEDLTLVVPTYQREAFALRSMRYWSGRGPTILLMDGGPQRLPANCLSGLGDNIRYVHAPISLSHRLKQAAELISTDFVSFIGDDEFHLPSSLAASIANLRSDKSLVACMGRAMRFRPNAHGEIEGSPVYPNLKNHRIDGSTPRERACTHMRNYVPALMYSVVRTEIWRAAHESHFRKEFPVYAIAEIQFELAVSMLGKSKVLPQLHWLRSQELATISTSPDVSLQKRNRVHTWWKSADSLEERLEFLEITSAALATKSKRPQEEIASEIEAALNEYVHFVEQMKTNKPPSKNVAHRSMLDRLLEPVKRPPAKTPSSVHSLMDEARELARSGVSVDFDELSEIEKILIEFHSAKTSAQLATP